VSRRAAVLALCLGGATAASPQAPGPSPSPQVFPGAVEQVTVDVVVVDKRGQPIEDLRQDDFIVMDEGRARSIASFDVVRSPAEAGAAPEFGARRSRVATNLERPDERGRLFVVVFDDLHMSPLNAQRAKLAVAEFLNHGTREDDRVTLVATGGGAWWTTRLPQGRSDLLTVLKHLDGRRVQDNALERLTDHEAVRIFVYRDVQVAARVMARFERYGMQSRQDLMTQQAQQEMNRTVPGIIDPYLEQRASEAYFKLKARLEITTGLLVRTLTALEDSRHRKAVLLVSEGFAYDPSFEGFKRASESARRANAAVYFIDTRGLEGLSSAYSAEFGAPFAEQDLMSAIADVSLEGEGAAALAEQTGGFAVRNTNAFGAGAARIGIESRSYYLLGYDPGEIPRDGRFRKLEVRVKRKDVTVRARRGYYAPRAEGDAAAAGEAGRDPGIQRALDAPGALDAIPLRMTAYALEDAGLAKARVVVAAQADVSKLAFPEQPGGALASLDTLVVVAHRESGDFHRADQRVDLARRASAPEGPAWYSFVREFALPAGGYQAKLVVRDATTQRVGSLIFEFEVPALDRLRVSTPILSDRLQPSAGGPGVTPTLQVDRSFAAGAMLYCMFDVYGAARGPDGMPRVAASHELRRSGGASVERGAPSVIEPTSLGALVRRIQIPLSTQAPGEYELLLTIQDRLSGESRLLVEPFTIAPAPPRASR
jgi:VWFA-related protein